MKHWLRAWKVRLILDQTPSWADLYETERFGPAAILPKLNKKQTDQLAKNLADLRSCDEIARNWIASNIIAGVRIGQCDPHEFRHPDRPSFRDDTAQLAGAIAHRTGKAMRQLRARGRGPKFRNIDGRLLVSEDDLADWIASHDDASSGLPP